MTRKSRHNLSEAKLAPKVKNAVVAKASLPHPSSLPGGEGAALRHLLRASCDHGREVFGHRRIERAKFLLLLLRLFRIAKH